MTMIRSLALCIIAVFSAVGITDVRAQTVEPLKIDDLLKMRSFGEKSPIAWSPHDTWIAYVIVRNQKAKAEGNDIFVRTGVAPRSGGSIWVLHVMTGQTRNLTGDDGTSWDPIWSPDGHYLAFLSDRGGSGQTNLWLWDSIRNKLRRASDLPVRVRFSDYGITWTPDSTRILVTVVPLQLDVAQYAIQVLGASPSPSASEDEVDSQATVAVYESNPSFSDRAQNGIATFNLDAFFLHDLVAVDIATGAATPLVRNQRIERFALSPDGSTVAYGKPKGFVRAGSYRRRYDLAVVDLATRQERTVASDIQLNDAFNWSPDSSELAYATYAMDGAGYEMYVASTVGDYRAPRKVSSVLHPTEDGLWLTPIWDPVGRNLYFILDGSLWRTSLSGEGTAQFCQIRNRNIEYVISQRDGQAWISDKRSMIVLTRSHGPHGDGFYRVDSVTGRSERLLERGECYSCSWPSTDPNTYLSVVSPTGNSLAYIAEDAQHPADLWLSDSLLHSQRQVTRFNPQLMAYSMGLSRGVEWRNDEGISLHGALLLPPHYQAETRYPLIVWVYPGAEMSWDINQFGFGAGLGPLNMQLFATRGYAVLFPDSVERVGERGQGLLESVLPAVNKVVELGIADPDKIGVIGHSQGGFAVLSLLVRTNRFKAAVAVDGWGDSTAYYGLMSRDGSAYQYGQTERQLGSTPWQLPMTYVENSPVYFLDRIETPLLLAHGGDDDEIASFLSDEVFVGLRRLGKPVTYAKYLGEPHVPSDWSYANQVDLSNRVIRWMEVYLNNARTIPETQERKP